MPLQRSRSGRAGPPPAEPVHREPLSSGTLRPKNGLSTTPNRKVRQYGENQPPENANIVKEAASPGLYKTASKKMQGYVGSPALPPMPPSTRSSPAQAGPLPASGAFFDSVSRRKLSWDSHPASGTEAPPTSAQLAGTHPFMQNHVPDNGVKVIVRVRPLTDREEQEEAIEALCTSSHTMSVAQQTFTFDSIAGPEASQHDLFNMVGVPMLDNCFAGFNSSIFAYGQTGSGKTYTMWGTSEDPTSNLPPSENRGIAPRLFEQLFVRIQQEEIRHAADHLRYQCRCSFLEIYNEQITDLLEPSQKNLQIREDTKTGVYVDSLTEEYVSGVNDISQLLMKGLANRRVGSTLMNNESSRSHSVFTCIIECRFKSLEQGVSSIRSSRMNLVDLAGSERQKQTGAAGERLKEAGNINRSLSQLGNVINILAEVAQSGKQRHIPYRDSRLTFLLQESLGGNAKLAMICALSMASSCRNETLSTLRFAKRAKAIQNKAVVNEERANDVKLLREQIRQLKEELMRMKGNDAQQPSAWNPRRSYNLLRMSLNHAMVFAKGDPSDEEMEIEEDEDMDIDDDDVEVNPGTMEMVSLCNVEGSSRPSSSGPGVAANGDKVIAVSTESGMVVEKVCSIQESGSQSHINSNDVQYVEDVLVDPFTVLSMGDARGKDTCALCLESGQVVNMQSGIQESGWQEDGRSSAVQQELDYTASDLIDTEGSGGEVCPQLADSGNVFKMICSMEPEYKEQESISDVQEQTLQRLSIAVSRDQPFYDCRSVFDSCSLLTPNGSISLPRNQQSTCGSPSNFDYLENRRLESPMQTESPRIGNSRALDDDCSSEHKIHYGPTEPEELEVASIQMQALSADTSQHGLLVKAAGSPSSDGQENGVDIHNGVKGCDAGMPDPVANICRRSAEHGHLADISLFMESDINAMRLQKTETSPGTRNDHCDDGPIAMATRGESPIMQCQRQLYGLDLESQLQTGSPIICKPDEGAGDSQICQSEALEPVSSAVVKTALQNFLPEVADNKVAPTNVDLCEHGQQASQPETEEVVSNGLGNDSDIFCQLEAVTLAANESTLLLTKLPLQAELVDDGFATSVNCQLEELPLEAWDCPRTALPEENDWFHVGSGSTTECVYKIKAPLLEPPDVLHQLALCSPNFSAVGAEDVARVGSAHCHLEALLLDVTDALQPAEAEEKCSLESNEIDCLPAPIVVTSHPVAVGEWPASVDWKNVSKSESVAHIETARDGTTEAVNCAFASERILPSPSLQEEALSKVPRAIQVGHVGLNNGVSTEEVTPLPSPTKCAFSFEVPTVDKVQKGVQTSPGVSGTVSNDLEGPRTVGSSLWQMVAVNECAINQEKPQTQLNKAVEALLAGAIRREEAAEGKVRSQAAEIEQLNRLIRQYKHERECNAILQQSREDKIARLESLMDGVLPSDAFLNWEWAALTNEHQVLLDKYDNHPEVTHSIIQQQGLIEELREYRDFFNLGEKDDMQKEIRQLRTQLQAFLESGPPPRPLDSRRRSILMQSISVRQSMPLRQSMCIRNPIADPSPLGACQDPMRLEESIGKRSEDLTVGIAEEFNDVDLEGEEKHRPPVAGGYLPVTQTRSLDEREMEWEERENDWMAVLEELRVEVDTYRRQAEMRTHELECERRCSEEVREALQMAMTGHARVLDQYAELQEKHISILAKHRKIRDGAADVKKTAKPSGLDSRWLESQAAKMTLMESDHEEERQAMSEEIANLRAKLNDTGEAVQAASELLVRLKEAEETICIAQDAALLAEQDADALQRELEKTKRKHGTEIATLHQRLLEARLQKSTLCQMCVMAERVKFEFTEVDAKTAQAELEAERRVADLEATACLDFPEHQLEESPVRLAGRSDDWDYESPLREYDPAAEYQYDFYRCEREWRC